MLELAGNRDDVRHQPVTGGVPVMRVQHEAQLDPVVLEDLQQLRQVEQPAGQAINVGDDDTIDLPGPIAFSKRWRAGRSSVSLDCPSSSTARRSRASHEQ